MKTHVLLQYDIAYSLSSDGEGLWELLDCCCLFILITLHLFSQHLLNVFSTSFPPLCLFSLSPFSFFCLSPIFLDELDCTVVLYWYGMVLYCCYNKHGSAKQGFLTTNAHYSSWMDTFADIRLVGTSCLQGNESLQQQQRAQYTTGSTIRDTHRAINIICLPFKNVYFATVTVLQDCH